MKDPRPDGKGLMEDAPREKRPDEYTFDDTPVKQGEKWLEARSRLNDSKWDFHSSDYRNRATLKKRSGARGKWGERYF